MQDDGYERIDFDRATVSVSQRKTRPVKVKGKGGKEREVYPWRVVLSYWVQDGMNDDGTPIMKRRQRNKTLPVTITTEKGAKDRAGEWVAQIKAEQDKAMANVAERREREEADRRAEEKRKAEEEAKAEEKSLWQVIDEYVDTRFRQQGVLEASTYADYRKCVARIHRTLPDRPAKELTKEDVARWDALMYGTEDRPALYALSTANKTRVILRASMRHASERHIIEENPVGLRAKPKDERRAEKNDTSKPKFNNLDRRNRSVLIAELGEVGGDDRAVAVAGAIALLTGLREGECCGLLWDDVDLGAGFINVRHAVGLGEGGAYLKLPKSDLCRTVPIAPELMPILRDWHTKCEKQNFPFRDVCDLGRCFVLGCPFKPVPDAVMSVPFDPWPLKDAGNMNPATLSRRWRGITALSKAKGNQGRRPTFHGLRHSFACAMANELHMPKEELAKILGHGDVKTTERYYLNEDERQRRDHLNEVMRAAYANGTMVGAVGEVLDFPKTGTEDR